ncbi:beta-ketoacyl reductase, partial [Streptomyces sp. NPDC001770]
NAHLDALVEVRRARGLVASSVAWGLWAGVGMAAGSGGERLRDFGMEGIDERRGMLALGQVLDAGEGAVVVAGFDWPGFVPTYTLRRPSRLLGDLPEVRAVLAEEQAAGPGAGVGVGVVGEWASRLVGVPVGEQRQVLTDLVRVHAAAVLGHESAEDVLPQRAFKDLGFDSVGAVELRNRLSKEVGVRLASTMVFDYPNATALAEYVRGELVGTERAAVPEGDADEMALRETISAIPLARIRQAGLLDLLLQLADPARGNGEESRTDAVSIDGMDAEDLIRIALDGKDS